MWTQTAEGRKFIEEISKNVVTQVAPEELDLFDEQLQGYFDNPDLSKASPSSDDALGFGLAEAMIPATPVIAAMTSTVLGFLVSEILKATEEESAALIEKKVKELFNPKKAAAQSPEPLTREQLEQVMKLAREQAVKFGVVPDQAEKMASALIGTLAMSH